ncbi:small subunit ribosomal protein S21 [Rhizobium leguminosarum]
MQVIVKHNNVEQAMRALKRKMQPEGVFREMRERRAYERHPNAVSAKGRRRLAPRQRPRAGVDRNR